MYINMYMKSGKMVIQMTLFAKLKERHRYRKQTYQGRKRGWEELGVWVNIGTAG